MKPSVRISLISLLMLAACAAPVPPAPTKPVPGHNTPLIKPVAPVPTRGEIPAMTPPVKVALLVPLSGESQAIGNAMLDAATLAISDGYLTVPTTQVHSQVVLLPKDTGNTPIAAAKVAQAAIEQGAEFIVGPLFSQSVTSIAPIAREHGVNVLSFSNNKSVASPDTFTFGFLPEQQVARIGDYAYLHDMQRVAVLAPNDSYGQKVQQLLTQSYTKKGGVVAPVELYAPNTANIEAAVDRLSSAYADLPTDRRFTAIFIADGGAQLKTIIAALKKHAFDLTKIKLLGTGLWDDPEIVKIPEMAGAWFPSSPFEPYQQFEKHFMAVYGYKPPRLASLAYDAVTLTVNLSLPAGAASLTTAALSDPHGYNGPANGWYRLHEDGTSERRLAIMEVTPNGFKVIDTAPGAF